MPPTATEPTRAPALYCAGHAGPTSSSNPPFHFRLPCPPIWDDRRPSAWAAERRARRAYFAALDALRTGQVDETEATKVDRLHDDLRSDSARASMRHFRRILGTVRRAAQPILPTPPAPLTALTITVPPTSGNMTPAALAERYRWSMEWMNARGYVVPKGLRLEWQVRPLPRPLAVPATVWTSTAAELRRVGRR